MGLAKLSGVQSASMLNQFWLGSRLGASAPPQFEAPAPADAGDERGLQPPAALANHILVLSDGSHVAEHVGPLAMHAASVCDAERITLLRVLEPASPGAGARVEALEWAMVRAQAEASLARYAATLLPSSATVQSVVAEGRAAEQIIHFCERNAVDLVVMASHGHGQATRWRLGSTARKVTARGGPSLLVVPVSESSSFDPGNASIRRVVVPLDCSTRAESVLPLARRLASAGAEIVLTHVVVEPELAHRLPAPPEDIELATRLTANNHARASDYLAALAARMREGDGRDVRVRLAAAPSAFRGLQTIIAHEAPDLVLLCAHGATCRSEDPYGAVAERLLAKIDLPLWVVQDVRCGVAAGTRPPQRLHSGLLDDER